MCIYIYDADSIWLSILVITNFLYKLKRTILIQK